MILALCPAVVCYIMVLVVVNTECQMHEFSKMLFEVNIH